MLRALLVTHGDLARVLLETAQGIVGSVEGVETLTNRGLSRDGLAQAVEERVAAWEGAGGIVLTDIQGGSCTQAALLGVAERRQVAVIAGVNLPMLVDFLVNRGHYDTRGMAERLVEKGRNGVRALAPPARAS